MAFTAKDGSRHTNRDSMKQADARLASKKTPQGQPLAGSQDADEMSGGVEEDPSAVAQQHGPAVEVTIQHEHEAGQHHVHSKHPDGHEHHSEHGSAEEAHDHAKSLAGHEEAPAGYEGQEGY